jgi:hypothetical protein
LSSSIGQQDIQNSFIPALLRTYLGDRFTASLFYLQMRTEHRHTPMTDTQPKKATGLILNQRRKRKQPSRSQVPCHRVKLMQLVASKHTEGGAAVEREDKGKSASKAKEEFPEAPVTIGMQDERGQKGNQ